MADDERLREALLELKVMREREALALAESMAIVEGLSAISGTERPGDGLERLLRSIRDSLHCDEVIHITARDDGATIDTATDPALVGQRFPAKILTIASPIRVVETGALDWWPEVPEPLSAMRSALSAPIALLGEPAGAIVCFSATPAHFNTSGKTLLSRLTAVAAQALRTLSISERNKLLAGVIDGASASVAIADARADEMPLRYVNDAFVRLSGYRRDEVLGKNCRFLSDEPPDSPERVRLRETLNARGSGTFDLRNRKRNGEIFWNRLTLYPIHGPSGDVEYMVATQVDITAERAAETARLEAETRLRSALSATSEGFLLLDAAGNVVFANERFADFYGERDAPWTPGASFEDMWWQRLVRRGMDEAAARADAAARYKKMQGGTANVEERLPDGRIVLRNDRVLGDGGTVSILTDITSLKATERMLAQRAAAIDATQDGIAITDEDGRFVYMNAAHLALFGYENEWEILGHHWTALYEPKQARFIEEIGLPALQKRGRWRAEIIGRARDGSPVEQEVSLTLLDEIGLICVTRDIAERQRNERERARLREQLATSQRQEEVGRLAAGVAHDFNNLLSVITTSANLIGHELGETHPANAHLNRILSAGTQAAGLVGRLLETGRRRVEPREVDISANVREATELLRVGVPSRVSVSLRAPDRPVILYADPGDILQVILNLGVNARDAMGGHAGEIKIVLDPDAALPAVCSVGSCAGGSGYVALSVSDTGPGIPEDVQRKIFKPYFSTKGDGGTGLGLAVVSSIVRQIGGGLTLSSAAGEGATFTVYWPIAPQDMAPRPKRVPRASAAAPDALRGHTVIVCDDAADVAEGLAAILESAGAEAAVCEDPRDALQAITEDPGAWSLLVTDFDMPGMDGGELAVAVRAVRDDLPIILCTALAGRAKRDAPFDATLEKPVDPAQLIAAAADAVAQRQKVGDPVS